MSQKSKLTNTILDLIFPNYCLQCKKIDELICGNCLNKERLQKPNLCPYCLEKSIMGITCLKCQEENPMNLNGLFYLQFYRERSVLIRALFELKYELRRGFAKIIADKMVNFWKTFLEKWAVQRGIKNICLMPSHSRKIKKRGFNQVELIWENIIKELPELKNQEKQFLIKTKNTRAQMSLKAGARKINAEGSFQIGDEAVPEKILIIDDIGTSLSTLNEASKLLKESGCKEVYAWVLARQILE